MRKTNRKLLTPDEKAEILKLSRQGLSYAKIGEIVNKSRSAIAGVVFRNKSNKVNKFNPHQAVAKKIKITQPMKTKIKGGITIFELNESTCRYMIGHEKYCGHSVYNRSYCQAHYDECCIKPRSRLR